MKRKLLNKSFLKQTALAIPAAALMLGSAHGGQIGINFQDNGNGNAYAPVVSGPVFGLDLAHWINAPSVYNSSSGGGFATNATFALPDGGTLYAAWSAWNTWSIYNPVPTNGDEQVIYGYLDDTISGSYIGYSITLSGFRNFASSYTITTIASSDSATAFADAIVVSDSGTNDLQYLNNYTSPVFGSGLAGTSTVSSAIATLAGNNTARITGGPKIVSGSDIIRSTLAGILIDYTSAATTRRSSRSNPQAPTDTLYPGGSFSLSVQASGTPVLGYQWRKDGVGISGATDATYTKNGIVVGDSGSFDVVVTNAYSPGATSAVVVVTVQNVTAPVITQYPLSQSLYVGYPATFTVAATGGQLSYQWNSNNVVIPGATNTTYSIPSVAADSGGTYTVEVGNPVGPTAAASATLTVKVAASAYETAVSQTKPLLWFRYSETELPVVETGSAANSGSSGPSDNGVAKFYTSFQQPGAIVGDANKSASFNGAQAIDVPYDAALNSATFTVELWANPTTVDTLGARSPLYNRGAAAGGGDGWLFWANNVTTSWQFRTYEGSARSTIDSTAAAVPGVWTHLVGVYDGTTSHFYVNGVEQGTGVAAGYTLNTSLPLRIGGAGNDTGAAGVNAWNGGVDEVAVYSTVLTPEVILSHYQNGTNSARGTAYDTLVQASTPVGYWRLNDPAGLVPPTPKNSGTLGAAWNGSYAGDLTPAAVGPRPPAGAGFESGNLAVAMTNGYVSAPLCTNLNVNTLTVAGWLNPATIPSGGDLGWPCWLGDGGMHIENTSGRPTRELRYHWKGIYWDWGSGLVAPADTWTFVAMVVEPTKATFYMSDGTTLKSAVHTATHDPLAVTSALGFGGNQPGRSDRTYIGQLDESAVYNRALTLSEINTLFIAGTGAPLRLQLSPGGMIQDSKPVGTLHPGANTELSCAWLASSTDSAATPVTRTGVEQFATTNASQIVIPADADFNAPVGTIMFWMLANAPIPGPGLEGAILFDRRTTSGTVIVLNDAGNIFVQCAGGANSFSAAYLPDGLWHLVAVTYDQSASGSVAIYVDGMSQGSQANSAAWSWPATQQIELGRSHDTYWKRYDGLMDDFRIYNRVLTDPEIASVYASDALVDTAALKVQYNFTTAGIGQTVSWPFGTLLSSPVLGPSANWTPVSGAAPPNYPFMPTEPALFFKATP